MHYECVVYDATGVRKNLTIQADSEQQAVASLYENGMHLVSMRTLSAPSSLFGQRSVKLNAQELEALTVQLSSLVGGKIKIEDAFSVVLRTSDNKKLKFVCSEILADLRDGKSVHKALKSQHGFDVLYTSLIEAAEASGTLAQVFAQLSDYLKFKKELKKQVSQALAYPALILIFSVLSLIFIFNVIVPQMSVMFSQQTDLPWYTTMLLSASDFVIKYQITFIPVIGVLIALVSNLSRMPSLSFALQRQVLRWPMVSQLVLLWARLQFSGCISLLLSQGITLERAFQYSIKTVSNKVLRIELSAAEKALREGSTLSSALANGRTFSLFQLGFIEVGEQSADLVKAFTELQQRDKDQLTAYVTRLSAILEPLLVLLMAGIVGSIVIVMMLSIIAAQDIPI